MFNHILDILLPSDFSKQNSGNIFMAFPLISSINCRINLFLKAQGDGIEILEEFRSDFQLAFVL